MAKSSKPLDNYSDELQRYLIHMGKASHMMDRKMETYMVRILNLLMPEDEKALEERYGLFGTPLKTLAQMAEERHVSPEEMQQQVERSLRKLAITPEWQMVKQMI